MPRRSPCPNPSPTSGAHCFGIGFVTLVIGRSELFTGDFLVPVGAVLQGRATMRKLARLWTVTMVGNVMGLLVLSLILTRADLVPPETLKAAGTLADTIAERHLLGAALSAVVAGLVMTLSTWAPTPSRPTSPGSLLRC